MIKCKKCGAPNPGHRTACFSCGGVLGKDVSKPVPPRSTDDVVCPKCGCVNAPFMTKCCDCGQPLEEAVCVPVSKCSIWPQLWPIILLLGCIIYPIMSMVFESDLLSHPGGHFSFFVGNLRIVLSVEAIVVLCIGLASLVSFIVLVRSYLINNARLAEMWAVKKYSARELKLMCSSGFSAIVEVEGDISCDHPIIVPELNIPCCWCNIYVEYESTERPEWLPACAKTISTVFKVTDDTGSTMVYPSGAYIDTETAPCFITNTREDWYSGLPVGYSGRYRVRAEMLVAFGHVYVLGQALPLDKKSTNPLVLIKGPDKGYVDPKKRIFIISRKKEDRLADMMGISVSVSLWFAILAFLMVVFCSLVLAGVIPYLPDAALRVFPGG